MWNYKPSNAITGFKYLVEVIYLSEDTICAIATAVGEGGIGIIRISGSLAINIVDKMFIGSRVKSLHDVKSHTAVHGKIVEIENQMTIDEVLVLVMRGPRSYTREDVVEIHCHGGPVPLRKILSLTLQYGARIAEPGEFTKRAFLNGRLDLSQAEAVMDIIRAKTEASLRMAVSQLDGRLSEDIQAMRKKLFALIVHLEAVIDFPEEDIEDIAVSEVQETVKLIIDKINKLLATANTGRILQDGLQTVIIGKPNVGKSSLLNALLREKRAIVTDIPGTTRDVIEAYVNIGGIPLKIADTAGIRDTNDIVEKIGVEKARELLDKADLILFLLDASQKLNDDDINILQAVRGKKVFLLLNKTDLSPVLRAEDLANYVQSEKIIPISVQTGFGLDTLQDEIVNFVYSGNAVFSESGFIHNLRHIESLKIAINHLNDALDAAGEGIPVDCITIDLRSAWEHLGKIVGETVNDDIINEIFARFCIGK